MGSVLRLKLAAFLILTGLVLAFNATAGTLPAVPTGVTATPGNSQVVLRWSAASLANSYRVLRSTQSGGPYTQIAASTWIGYTDVSVNNGTTYYYVILSADSSGESAKSAQVSARPGAASALAAPTGVVAKAGNSQVSLTWSGVATAASYRVDRATTSGGPYTQIAASTCTCYTDVGANNGITYYYVILAANSGGESGKSAQVSARPAATVAVSTPVDLVATPGNSQVGLRWSPVTGATSYHLLRSGASNGTYTQIAAPTWYGYTDESADNGVTYFYKVSAIAAAGQSALSAAVSATPSATPGATPGTAGLKDDFFGLSWSALQASHFPTVPFGGIRAWDTGTSWAQIETSQNNYNWSTLDAWLTMESSRGKDVMYTFGFVPTWASLRPAEACAYRVTDPGCAAPPKDIGSGDNLWKAFVTALVKHSLSHPSLHIAYYELWNEPDLLRDWTGTPAQLVTMAKDAYTIIHQLDPSAKVIGPSPSTATQFGVHFLPAYYAAGGATAQDIVGMHAYLYDGNTFSTSSAGITDTISELRKLMATYGITSKSIWFTEGNWGNINNNTMTAAQKSAYVTQEYLLMWSSGVVGRFYWYSWDSSALGTLWSSTSGIQPAGTAYGRLATWLIGSVHPANPCSRASDSTWTCTLTLSSGYPAEIIWNPGTSKTITVGAAYATFETLANTAVSSISSHQVAIGPEPIMIIGSQAN